MVSDGSGACSERHIVLRKRDGGLQRIRDYDRLYDALHYVLLFPSGIEGWSLKLRHLMMRPGVRTFMLAGRPTGRGCLRKN